MALVMEVKVEKRIDDVRTFVSTKKIESDSLEDLMSRFFKMIMGARYDRNLSLTIVDDKYHNDFSKWMSGEL